MTWLTTTARDPDPVWLERLKRYEREGFGELAGPDSNPIILKWAHGVGQADYMKDDSKTPWCGICQAGNFDECGMGRVVPSGPAAAVNWLNCGVPCEPRVGCIVVSIRSGGHHVAILRRIRPDGKWDCIGGNQSDRICTVVYDPNSPTSRLLGTRWPVPLMTASTMSSESRIAAAAGRQGGDLTKAGTLGTPASTGAPVPSPPSGFMATVDGWIGKAQGARGILELCIDLGGFLLGQWRIVLGAVALYFLARVLFDSMQIKAWRVEDHNTGRSQ